MNNTTPTSTNSNFIRIKRRRHICGLHGIITDKSEANGDDFIRSAFVANTLRGTDSSGIATIDTRKNIYDYHKLPVGGYHFIGDRVADGMIRQASRSSTITMCHVRAATVGSVTLSNAHPFVHVSEDEQRTVIGTHNGTLTGWTSKKNAKYYTVDSEWAINHIAEEGFDAFEDLRGAYCFVWWDSEKQTMLNIARNKERPMYVAMLESGGMAYASEAGMLFWLLERHNVKMKGSILELEAGYWYKFDVHNPEDFVKVKLPSVEYRPAKKPPVKASTFATSMDKVKDLIARVKVNADKESTGQVVRFPGKHPNVSQHEHDAARNLNLLGNTAVFSPYAEWSDGIEGLASVLNAELSASVRGYDSKFDTDEEWICPIIGVQDDENDMVLILGHPTMKDHKNVVH